MLRITTSKPARHSSPPSRLWLCMNCVRPSSLSKRAGCAGSRTACRTDGASDRARVDRRCIGPRVCCTCSRNRCGAVSRHQLVGVAPAWVRAWWCVKCVTRNKALCCGARAPTVAGPTGEPRRRGQYHPHPSGRAGGPDSWLPQRLDRQRTVCANNCVTSNSRPKRSWQPGWKRLVRPARIRPARIRPLPASRS